MKCDYCGQELEFGKRERHYQGCTARKEDLEAHAKKVGLRNPAFMGRCGGPNRGRGRGKPHDA